MDGVGLHAPLDVDDVPAVGAEARGHVLGEGEVGGALDGDLVVVVEDDELAEAEVAGEGGGLGGDALHEVTVGGDDVGVVVDDRVAGAVVAGGEPLLGDGEADGVGEALAEGAGGDLHAGGQAALRVAGGDAAPLAEALDLVKGEVVAGEMEEAVEEHGGVAGGEDEAVAVVPVGVRGVVLEEAVPEGVGHGRGAHRAAGVSVARLLHRIGGEQAEGVDAEGVQAGVRHAALLMRPAAPFENLRANGGWWAGRPLGECAARRPRASAGALGFRLHVTPRRGGLLGGGGRFPCGRGACASVEPFRAVSGNGSKRLRSWGSCLQLRVFVSFRFIFLRGARAGEGRPRERAAAVMFMGAG